MGKWGKDFSASGTDISRVLLRVVELRTGENESIRGLNPWRGCIGEEWCRGSTIGVEVFRKTVSDDCKTTSDEKELISGLGIWMPEEVENLSPSMVSLMERQDSSLAAAATTLHSLKPDSGFLLRI